MHTFLAEEYGADYQLPNPSKFAVFEDHLLYAHHNPKFVPFMDKVQTLRDLQNAFQQHTLVRDYSAVDGVSPGICHQVAREEFIEVGDFVKPPILTPVWEAHPCAHMGSWCNGIFQPHQFGLLLLLKFQSQFDLNWLGNSTTATAKDVIVTFLPTTRKELTLNRSMEFGGSGLASLSIDERATLCNMATECSARTGICEPDEALFDWMKNAMPDLSLEEMRQSSVIPDKDANYDGGIHIINLSDIEPMVAHPVTPTRASLAIQPMVH